MVADSFLKINNASQTSASQNWEINVSANREIK
jgi:hypothetical protein